jgi:hypothetical protein
MCVVWILPPCTTHGNLLSSMGAVASVRQNARLAIDMNGL